VWQAPSVVYGLFGIVLALVVFALGRGGLYEMGRRRREEVTFESESEAVNVGKSGLGSRSMLLLMGTMVCWGLTQYGYLGLFVTFLRQQQHFTLGAAVTVLSIAGWVSFGSSFLMGWVSDHIGRRNTLLISGSIGLIMSYPLFTLTGSFWPAVIIAALFQSCNGHFYPMGVAYAQDMSRAHLLGGHSGAVSGIGHIMAGIAGFVAGAIAGSLGFGGVAWEFTALSALMVVCIYLTVDPVHAARVAERRTAAGQLAIA
ncbi:MAG TPA: MFS transporter, partial [Chloroflexota bacterium]